MARRREEESEGGGHIDRLPEGCISHVLSFTTPRDSCRSALVSAAFCSAASFDALWERFLPSDYQSILSQAVDPMRYSSKRELYFRLCDSILIDGGKMQSFQLERSTGRKCYMLSPRSMHIIWWWHGQYWRWFSLPESRIENYFSKTQIIGLNQSEKGTDNAAKLLSCKVGSLPITYLGLPLHHKALRVSKWRFLTDKIEKKLAGWKKRILSLAGYLVLVNFVIRTLPIYWMSVLQLSKAIIKKIDGSCCAFL